MSAPLSPGGLRPLTPRAAEALDWLCRGATRQQTAQRMGISPETVKSLLAIGYRALGCSNGPSAALLWAQLRYPAAHGLLCARCGVPTTDEDRLLAAGYFE
jgi:DNA-binding CsgD family transcriptional regulator